jgi:hypothetical protein
MEFSVKLERKHLYAAGLALFVAVYFLYLAPRFTSTNSDRNCKDWDTLSLFFLPHSINLSGRNSTLGQIEASFPRCFYPLGNRPRPTFPDVTFGNEIYATLEIKFEYPGAGQCLVNGNHCESSICENVFAFRLYFISIIANLGFAPTNTLVWNSAAASIYLRCLA